MPAFQKPTSATATRTDTVGNTATVATTYTVASQTSITSVATATESSGLVTTTTATSTYASAVVAKTSNYTVTAADAGTCFVTTGAGTTEVDFTLPAVASSLGCHFTFICSAAHLMKVLGVSSASFKGPGGATSTVGVKVDASVATGSANNEYTRVEVWCDGATWLTTVNGTATFL